MKRLDLRHAGETVFPHALPLPLAAGAALLAWSSLRPHGGWLVLAGCAFAGFASWTLLEYLLHRFILHGVEPFRGWHAEHHRDPNAPMRTPLAFSGLLLLALVVPPLMAIDDGWLATGLALGLLAGHVAQEITHHLLHARDAAGSRWLARCQRQHLLHHGPYPSCAYGTLTGFWDRAFGTQAPPQRER